MRQTLKRGVATEDDAAQVVAAHFGRTELLLRERLVYKDGEVWHVLSCSGEHVCTWCCLRFHGLVRYCGAWRCVRSAAAVRDVR